ncbi:MAG: hypothetical protein HS130_00220 [Deltaproteobacteria bacterium]|nr:hypothetical protein [Deltaproteobacteria bacterium]MCL4873986.1 hypothetical protein [bacterium]
MHTIALIVIIAVSLGIMPAFIAMQKGRSFLIWWVYGTLAFVIAMPHALFLDRGLRFVGGGTRTCGFCRMKVSISAAHCPRCGHEFIEF